MKALTVLLLDDSPTFLEILRKTIQREGHTVVGTTYWGELAARIRESRPDVLIVDMNLDHPGITGLIVAKTIRKFYDLPILFLSSEPESVLERATTEVRDSRYLAKRDFERSLGPMLSGITPRSAN